MAIASVSTITATTDWTKTAGTTLTFTPSNQINVDDCVILVVALDNDATVLTTNPLVTSVTDSKGNFWVRLGNFSNDNGTAAGASVSVWTSKVTTTILTSDTITVTNNPSVTARAVSGWRFAVTSGNGLRINDEAGARNDIADDNIDPSSSVIASQTSQEYLFLRAIAYEQATNAFTITTNYTALTNTAGSGGGGASNMNACGEFRILTATGDTSNPSMATTADQASIYCAIEEIAQSNNVGKTWPEAVLASSPVWESAL